MFDVSQVDPDSFISLRHYGSTGGDREDMDCNAGTWSLELACEMNCGARDADTRKCTKTSDGDYQCKCDDKPPAGCKAGKYEDGDDCTDHCDGGMCSLNADDGGKAWTCKCEAAEECKKGKYKDWDDCSSHCYQGQCQENAGDPMVYCVSCP